MSGGGVRGERRGLRPGHRDVGGLGPRGVELGLGLGDVGLRGRAALVAVRREPQRRLEGVHCLVEELLLRVGRAQLEIVQGQLRLQAQARRLEVGGGRLRLAPGRRHRAPHAAPQVDLVGHVEREQQVAAVADVRARAQEGLIRGLTDRAEAGARGDRGKERRAIEADERARLAQPRLGDLQILVGRRDLHLERLEVGIGEDGPPPALRQMIARRGGLPAVSLLVGRGHRRRGFRVLGPDHAAPEQERGQRSAARARRFHRGAPAGAVAIRTRVPLVRESGGPTTTWSVGARPETISTVWP